MKRWILVSVCLVAAMAVTVSAFVYTNAIGQVVTVTVGTNGVGTAIAAPASPAAVSRTEFPALGCRTFDDTAALPAAYTPRGYGDVLIGTVTNTVHISAGLTTNDWVKVGP